MVSALSTWHCLLRHTAENCGHGHVQARLGIYQSGCERTVCSIFMSGQNFKKLLFFLEKFMFSLFLLYVSVFLTSFFFFCFLSNCVVFVRVYVFCFRGH